MLQSSFDWNETEKLYGSICVLLERRELRLGNNTNSV